MDGGSFISLLLSNEIKAYIVLIVISILSLLYRNLWAEPDVIGIYDFVCNQKGNIDIPIISFTILKTIPCSIFFWKIAHVLFVLFSLSSFYYLLRKAKASVEYLPLIGLCFYLLVFFIGFEDDQIVFPIIVGLIGWLYEKNNVKRKLIVTIIGLCLFFVWRGAPLILGIAVAAQLHLVTGLLIIFFAYIERYIGFNVAGSNTASEQILGNGFLTNNILSWFAIAYSIRNNTFEKNKTWFSLLICLLVASFVYPKLGTYTIIPAIVILARSSIDNVFIKRVFFLCGILSLTLGTAYLNFSLEPSSSTVDIIKIGVEKQNHGEIVLNDWWAGYWFQHYGGVPYAKGGSSNEYSEGIPVEHYWIGRHRKECLDLNHSGYTYFQKCPITPDGFI